MATSNLAGQLRKARAGAAAARDFPSRSFWAVAIFASTSASCCISRPRASGVIGPCASSGWCSLVALFSSWPEWVLGVVAARLDGDR